MNKADLIEHVANETGTTKADAQKRSKSKLLKMLNSKLVKNLKKRLTNNSFLNTKEFKAAFIKWPFFLFIHLHYALGHCK